MSRELVDLSLFTTLFICAHCQRPIEHLGVVPYADRDMITLELTCHGEQDVITLTGSEMVQAATADEKIRLVYYKSRLLGGQVPALMEDEP